MTYSYSGRQCARAWRVHVNTWCMVVLALCMVPAACNLGLVHATWAFFRRCGMDLIRRQRYADTRHDTSKMPSNTTNVAEKPTVVMQIMDEGSMVRVGNTIVVEFVLESSRANVRSPVDTTLMMRLTPTSSSFSAGAAVVPVADLLCSRCLTRLSSLGRAEPILAYTSSGAGGGPYSDAEMAG